MISTAFLELGIMLAGFCNFCVGNSISLCFISCFFAGKRFLLGPISLLEFGEGNTTTQDGNQRQGPHAHQASAQQPLAILSGNPRPVGFLQLPAGFFLSAPLLFGKLGFVLVFTESEER